MAKQVVITVRVPAAELAPVFVAASMQEVLRRWDADAFVAAFYTEDVVPLPQPLDIARELGKIIQPPDSWQGGGQ